MSLKKRKTPLSELFAEREALRKQPISIFFPTKALSFGLKLKSLKLNICHEFFR